MNTTVVYYTRINKKREFIHNNMFFPYIQCVCFFLYSKIKNAISISILFLFSLGVGPSQSLAGDETNDTVSNGVRWYQQQLQKVKRAIPKMNEVTRILHQKAQAIVQQIDMCTVCNEAQKEMTEAVETELRWVGATRVLFQEAVMRNVPPPRADVTNFLELRPGIQNVFVQAPWVLNWKYSLLNVQRPELERAMHLVETGVGVLQNMTGCFVEIEQGEEQSSGIVDPECTPMTLQQYVLGLKLAMHSCTYALRLLGVRCHMLETVHNRLIMADGTLQRQLSNLDEETQILDTTQALAQLQARDRSILQQQQAQEAIQDLSQREEEEDSRSSHMTESTVTPTTSSIVSFESPDTSTQFVSGYDVGGNVCSLHGVQVVLGSATNKVVMLLKNLVLHTLLVGYPAFRQRSRGNSSQVRSGLITTPQKNTFLLRTPVSRVQAFDTTYSPIQVFSSLRKTRSTVEHTTKSVQTGCMVRPTSNLTIGFSCEYMYDNPQKMQKIQMNSSIGAASLCMKTTVFSGIAAWNTDQPGFTGQIAGCFGRGSLQIKRYFTHSGTFVAAKGYPMLQQKGGIIRCGYTLLLLPRNNIQVTPYVAYMRVRSTWNDYREKNSPLPRMISTHTEDISEKCIGLWNRWNIDGKSYVHGWVATLFSQYTTAAIQSQPLRTSFPLYRVSIPITTSKAIQNEVGMSYETMLQEGLSIAVNGSMRFKTIQKGTDRNVRFFFQYVY